MLHIGSNFEFYFKAIVYFDTVKDTTVHYGKIVSAKSADFILDGIDMASDGYGMVHPYIQKAVDGTKDTLGPYIGPYVGPYWDAFYNHVAEMYKESNALARRKWYFTLILYHDKRIGKSS